MSKYLFILLTFLTTAFFSCSKDDPGTQNKVANVSFVANGVSYNWNEVGDDRNANYCLIMFYSSAPGRYHFSASNDFSSVLWPQKEVWLTFETGGGNYVLNTPYTLSNTVPDNSFPPHSVAVATTTTVDLAHIYGASAVGDFATITITSVHDGLIDGTFSGTLTRYSDQSKINITNGTFKNVEITP